MGQITNWLFEINFNKRELFDMSYKVILSLQGVGSGFDIAAAVYGGTQYYVTGGKVIEPLHLVKLPLVVGYSGVNADTSTYIRKVADTFKNKKEELKKIYISIAALVEEARTGLETGDFEKTGKCMTQNHTILQKLEVSIPQLDSMVEAANSAGAWGAKLSGAGGGDCMIALVPDDSKDAVEKAIKKVGGEIIAVDTNANGVE